MTLRLGTRASALARWQAEWVAARLREHGHKVELVLITTQGDETQGIDAQPADAGTPVGSLGAVGVFTKELQRALLDDRIDLAVHSLKDLPTDPIAGLALAAVPKRESVHDVLISRECLHLEQLPSGATIGTGSLRRRAQVLNVRPELRMADIRGNVDTRLRKLREGQYDAIILAEAGLNRLGLSAEITEILSLDRMLPAVGQGALAIEARESDKTTQIALAALDHAPTHAAVLAERELLARLRGGCLAPVGAFASCPTQGRLELRAAVLSPDGSQRLSATGTGDESAPRELGQQVADELLSAGADQLIALSRPAKDQ